MVFSTPKEHLFNVITPVTYLELLCLRKEEGRRMFVVQTAKRPLIKYRLIFHDPDSIFTILQAVHTFSYKYYGIECKIATFSKILSLYITEEMKEIHQTSIQTALHGCLVSRYAEWNLYKSNRLILCIRYISHQWYTPVMLQGVDISQMRGSQELGGCHGRCGGRG